MLDLDYETSKYESKEFSLADDSIYKIYINHDLDSQEVSIELEAIPS